LDAEAVCDSVDVGVVGGDGANVEDVAVREASGPERPNIPLVHVAWRTCEFFDIAQHGDARIAQTGGSPIGFYRSEQLIVPEEASQTATVVAESVVAVVDVAHHESDELSFDFSERLRP
jgi:hypothetical protein